MKITLLTLNKKNDGENYGQSSELFIENIIPDSEETQVYSSSISEYVSYRSDDIIVGESNKKLILDYPIA